ncbi:MAG TPA: DUF1819 family protein [Bacteroidales bacterium]|jgi:hypothetical protein|nr:DUF1819 family protein [Bacteroidales bacterium]HRS19211.1 DUF1819 family protein [Bacteroidales bacterium]
MIFLEKIYHYFQLKKIPLIGLYVLSNDVYFSTIFLKKISIDTPHYFKTYKHCDECLLELQTNSTIKHILPFIVIDNSIFLEQTPVTNKNEFIEAVFANAPNIHVVQLDNAELQNFVKDYNNTIISKNENSYKRVEQIIFTVCNDFTIIQQKKYNKIIFIVLSIIIILIISFLSFYIVQKL